MSMVWRYRVYRLLGGRKHYRMWAIVYDGALSPWDIGFLFRPGSMWIGAHYSANHKRVCLNLLPCCTIWIVGEGGDIPTKESVR